MDQERYAEESPNEGDLEKDVQMREGEVRSLSEELRTCEEALTQSEERFTATFHCSPVAIAIVTAVEQRMLDVNEAFLTLTGYERSALIGHEAGPGGFGFFPEHESTRLDLDGAPAADVEHRIQTRSGQERVVLVAWSEVDLFGTKHHLCTFHDITKRKELERDVIRIGDETRRRIAGDLHDELGQQLVAAAFQSDALGDDLESKGLEEEAARVRRLAATTREALHHVRDLSHQLSPLPIEGPDGMMEALSHLAQRVGEVFPVACRFHRNGPVPMEDREAALHLYRIAQEAVTNAVKHARPSTINISVLPENGVHVLRVCDDGTGLDREQLAGGRGMGLRTMQYRADLIGAGFDVRAAEGGTGTVVECRFEVE